MRGRDYLHHIPGVFTAWQCSGCGFWYQNPRPRDVEAPGLYPDGYLPYRRPEIAPVSAGMAAYLRRAMGYRDLEADEPGVPGGWLRQRVFAWQAGVDLVPSFVPGGRLLDIGCASGGRLLQLRRLGWEQVEGIELSPGATETARALGFRVQCGAVEDVLANCSDAGFDVVVASMVIEHVVNPFRVVAQIARKLKPGGQFIFSTVVRDSLDAWLYPEFWSGFDFPRHMVYFRCRDVRRMLAPSFDRVRMCRHSAPIDFVRSATWHRMASPRSSMDRLVLRMAESRCAPYIGLMLAWSAMTSRISVRCRRTSTMNEGGTDAPEGSGSGSPAGREPCRQPCTT